MHVPACWYHFASIRLSGLEGAVGALKKATETTNNNIDPNVGGRWPGPCTAFWLELDIHAIPIQDACCMYDTCRPCWNTPHTCMLLVCNAMYVICSNVICSKGSPESRLLSCQHLFFVFRSALREHDRSVRLAKI